MSVGLAMHHLFREGLLIPATGLVLMIVPITAVRLTRPGSRESLDGFIVGALAGLMFSAAATLTRLAPQVVTGLIAHTRPLRGLVVEVVLGGVTVPITAAAAGGMVGLALWFRQRDDVAGHHGRVHLVLAAVAAAALLGHATAAVADMVGLAEVIVLIVHLTAMVLILLLLRMAAVVNLLVGLAMSAWVTSVSGGLRAEGGRANWHALVPAGGLVWSTIVLSALLATAAQILKGLDRARRP